ncbi:hypothetical protein [Calothrix sp. PCC 6303]|uniref:hypothetical protein n=1 Tax=Calothrix sp. PCC 6303 TaxID=1170562 RepID=UPI0005A20526|nr:hypothetical protein [Calothrix sp. PCC 6303]
MKTDQERQELIQDIIVLLYQAYDSTLDNIHALLKRIDDMEDEEDLQAIQEAREDIRINGTVSWNEIKEEIRNESKKSDLISTSISI